MKRALICSLFLLLNACGSGGSNPPVDNSRVIVTPENSTDVSEYLNNYATQQNYQILTPKGESALQDYNFSGEPDYVEVRSYQSDYAQDSSTDFDVLYEFDSAIKAELSEIQLFYLNEAFSEYGYDHGCLPFWCPIYLVALSGEQVTVVDNQDDLQMFLGDLDRPHELHFMFFGGEYPSYFKAVDDGYLVLTEWFDCNGRIGANLWHVDTRGNKTLRENLIEQDIGMVC